MKDANKADVKFAAYKTSKDAVCASITGGVCNAGDVVFELAAETWGVSTPTSAYTTAKNNHDAAVTALGPLKAKLLIANRDKATAIQANTDKK